MQNLCVQDYQGNNRAVVLNDFYRSSVSQQTHYYPFGGIIGDLSSTYSYDFGCGFRFCGKELDRFGGLDLYDFNARQYDPILGGFTSVDPLAEKYYGISPYAYCAGDPVNCIDPTGEDVWMVDENGNVTRHAYDGMDVICYTNGGNITTKTYFEKGTVDGHEGENGGYVFSFNDNAEAAKEVFETAADNSNVEWSRIEAENRSDGSIVNNVATSRDPLKEYNGVNSVAPSKYLLH